ncbi:MAG: proton-conducting transporter membrane subunit [bacterium]|nr:proton-conducting transporter membrane subunit [bacterium]
MRFLVLMPLLLPLLVATLSLLPRQWRLDRELLALVGSAGHFGAGLYFFFLVRAEGILVVDVGGWPAPYGIVLVFDLLSVTLLATAGFLGFCVALYSLGSVDPERQSFGYFPVFHLLLMGVSGAFLAGDLFNLFVWFEVILIASFVLLTLGGERAQIVAGVKYVAINMVASTLFLAAIGLLYRMTGSLNLADLHLRVQELEDPRGLVFCALLFLVAFGIKAAVFPFFFWLPESYPTPPAAVGAIFAGLLTKVGVYAMLRLFTLLFFDLRDLLQPIFLGIAITTMVVGVLGAWSQKDMRRILSFHIVSQIGYMMIGLALWVPLALAGAVFFMLHNIFAKTNLFLISGVIGRLSGSYDLRNLGGLYHSFFLLGMLFLVPALALAGVPPLSGFFGKLALIRSSIEEGAYSLAAVAMAVSVITLLSMLKIWHFAFWQPAPSGEAPNKTEVRLLVPILLLATATLTMGLAAQVFLQLCGEIAQQLLHPEPYIQAVLGRGVR